MKNYFNGVAKNIQDAENAASDFFKTKFNHSGRTGRERVFVTECDCGETTGVEFYSKDDPGMDDTFTVVICESCWESAPNKERI